MGRKPDFLIIGAMKAGTTSLHDYMGKHPDIFTTTPKEIHFFTENTFEATKMEEYYHHFYSDKKVVGASPQNYTKAHRSEFSGVPQRLAKYCPDIKLIYLVRDPIKRIISHFNEAQEGGYAPEEGLNASLRNNPSHHYIKTSMYYEQIGQYLPYFNKSQLLVVSLEELKDNRLSCLNEIFTFLGVKRMIDDTAFDYKLNQGTTKRTRNNWNAVLSSIWKIIPKSLVLQNLKTEIKKRSWFNNLTTDEIKKETLSEEVTALLKKELKEDVSKLREYTGKMFDVWSL